MDENRKADREENREDAGGNANGRGEKSSITVDRKLVHAC